MVATILITALSGFVASVFLAALRFIEIKITGREDDRLTGKLFYKIIRKNFESLEHKKQQRIDLLAKFIYGMLWSAPIPILFFQFQPKSLYALVWLTIVYFLIFLILDQLIHYAFKIGTPIWQLWDSHFNKLALIILYNIVYCAVGVFAFIGLAYSYVILFLI